MLGVFVNSRGADCVGRGYKAGAAIVGLGVEEGNERAGGTFEWEVEAVLVPDSVMGSPRSLNMFRAFPKSDSFRNFS